MLRFSKCRALRLGRMFIGAEESGVRSLYASAWGNDNVQMLHQQKQPSEVCSYRQSD